MSEDSRWCARCGGPTADETNRDPNNQRWCRPCWTLLQNVGEDEQTKREREWLVSELTVITGLKASEIATRAREATLPRGPERRPYDPRT